MLRSGKLAALTTICCLAAGYPFAWFTARFSRRQRLVILILLMIPFWTNSLVRTYAIRMVLGTNGLLNTLLLATGLIDSPLKLLYTDVAVILGLFYLMLPFMILPLYANLEKLDYRLVEAARDLGAGPLQSFRRVIVPLSLPGIFAGCIMVFVPTMGLFYVASTARRGATAPDRQPHPAAVSQRPQLAPRLGHQRAPDPAHDRHAGGLRHGDAAAGGQGAALMKNSLRLLFFSGIFLYLYVPIVILIVNAFNLNRYGLKWDGFTLKWFAAMLANPGLMEATRHSLVIAVCAATAATAIGCLAAIGFNRYRFAGRRILQGTIMTLMMAPDIILAIALLVLFVVIGISLGFWSLLLSHITFCLPFTVMTVAARLQGFEPMPARCGPAIWGPPKASCSGGWCCHCCGRRCYQAGCCLLPCRLTT